MSRLTIRAASNDFYRACSWRVRVNINRPRWRYTLVGVLIFSLLLGACSPKLESADDHGKWACRTFLDTLDKQRDGTMSSQEAADIRVQQVLSSAVSSSNKAISDAGQEYIYAAMSGDRPRLLRSLEAFEERCRAIDLSDAPSTQPSPTVTPRFFPEQQPSDPTP